MRRRLLLTVTLSWCAACSSPTTSPTPAPSAAPLSLTFPYPSVTLSGTITDAMSGQPIRDVRVFVDHYPSEMRPLPSDAAGTYQTLGVPAGSEVRYLQAAVNGYVQQCAIPVVADGGQKMVDIRLARPATLSSAVPPYPPTAGTRIVKGRVFSTALDGTKVVAAGVGVSFMIDFDYVAAWTTTDSQGAFLLCGLPTGPLTLTASRYPSPGYAAVVVAPGTDTTVEFALGD